MTFRFPAGVLAQHTAVLGKTGSGKTSTAKLMIEQVVPDGARVCILDPLKSDWWGITSSADGKRAGLPFVILGGPHGHVPLHSSAGEAIGKVVANGSLPLSIIDMADFEGGGLQRFFVDFAETLYKRNKGVVYLVIEEAHEFAPKERSGIGAENMAIHWAKKLATGSRTKGIRLIVASQRTQALHNALIGSCDTMIAHRMTAPADQKPVLDWLKANAGKDAAQQVADSFSNIKTGSAYLASGEAKIFEFVSFPLIQTYDNTKTPDGKTAAQATVNTAKVDISQLTSVIGEAVKEAKANDPAELRKQIAELQRQIKATPAAAAPVDTTALERHCYAGGFREGQESIVDQLEVYYGSLDGWAKNMPRPPVFKLDAPPRAPTKVPHSAPAKTAYNGIKQVKTAPTKPPHNGHAPASGSWPTGARRRIMIALAQNPQGLTPRKLGIVSGVKEGGSTWRAAMAQLRKDQHLFRDDSIIELNREGQIALGDYEPLPTGEALLDYWRSQFSSTRLAVFNAILRGRGRPVDASEVAAAAGVELGGSTWRAHMAHLRGLELVSGSDQLTASEDLFS